MPKYTILTGDKYVVEADNEAEALAKFEASSNDVEFIEVDTCVVGYTNVVGEKFEHYCEVCGNYSNDECDCCLGCMENIHECECGEVE